MERPYLQPVESVLQEMGTSLSGLASDEAAARLAKYGPNEIETFAAVSPFRIFLRQFKDFFIYLLLLAAAITLSLGEFTDTAVILLVIIVNGIMGFYQEFRAEKSLERLRELTSPTLSVLRDGLPVTIPARDVVPGDVLLLEEGDILPADGRVVEIVRLSVNEAVLTGESHAVEKSAEPLSAEATNPADMPNMVFSGTTVTGGRGKAVVTATGLSTEVGKIARLLSHTLTGETPLKTKIERFSRRLGIAIVGLCVTLFLIGLWRGTIPVVDLFLTVVSLAVATVPEALPIVITLILALGVQTMAGRRALVRKLPAVETLGAVTVICSDKTGTLTRNEMTVQKIYLDTAFEVTGVGYETDGVVKGLSDSALSRRFFEIAENCNNSRLDGQRIGDPMDLAMKVVVRKGGLHLEAYRRLEEIPLDSAKRMMTVVVERDGTRLAMVKGAPEEVIGRCTRIMLPDGSVRPFEEQDARAVDEVLEKWTEEAYRVLALAYAEGGSSESDLVFTGMAAFMDPPAEGVVEAVQRCREAGIRVIMITGDHLKTALAVARRLGIALQEEEAVDGRELRQILDREDEVSLEKRIENVRVFARVTPEDKLRIVEVLQRRNHVVAMTGDGVNDAPALKKAEVGIAMGQRGTEVAKEASAIILTDDNFVTITAAIEEGRKVYANIKKAIFFLLKTNFGEVIVVSFGFFSSNPMVLTPLMILWINLVTDSLPALAFAREPVTSGLMKQPPRDPREEIMDIRRIVAVLGLGGILAAVSLTCFTTYCELSLDHARSMTFNVLSMGQLFMAFGFRDTFFRNPWMFGGFAVSFAAQMAIFYIPFTVEAMRLVPPSPVEWGLVFFISIMLALITWPVRKWARI